MYSIYERKFAIYGIKAPVDIEVPINKPKFKISSDDSNF